MINMTSTSGDVGYGVKQYMLDSEADLNELEEFGRDAKLGSAALVVPTGDVYVKTTTGWAKLGG